MHDQLSDIRIAVRNALTGELYKPVEVTSTPVQRVWVALVPLNTQVRPFVRNDATDESTIVEIRIARCKPTYTAQLPAETQVTVEVPVMERGISKPDGSLMYEFLVWGDTFDRQLPGLVAGVRSLIGHHTLFLFASESLYKQVLRQI